MEIEVLLQSKSIQTGGPNGTVIIMSFSAVNGLGNCTLFMSAEQSEQYKLGQKYTITLK